MRARSINISKEEGRKYLPLELRIQLYDEIHRLRKQRLTYKEIQKKSMMLIKFN